MSAVSKIFIFIGALLIITGVTIHLAGNKLNWIGNLPGDIRVEKENFRFYFPITTMILFSIIISLILRVIRKFL